MAHHTNPAEIDPASWAERDTDAGTKPWPPARQEPDPDEVLERQVERDDYYDLRELVVATLRAAIANVEESRRG